ncbi:L-lactate dehydrogenase C chain [Ptiloglossa arizonensis]|uniref:L-lactate dehydrogenase C chain n=1 Tax=Ptiloglossa arizonensis TaxID=3350558 RepID=UPI003F9ED520
MILSSCMLSISSFIKCTTRLTSRKCFCTSLPGRAYPPTILSEVFAKIGTKKFVSADFGKDATVGSDFQRAVSFVNDDTSGCRQSRFGFNFDQTNRAISEFSDVYVELVTFESWNRTIEIFKRGYERRSLDGLPSVNSFPRKVNRPITILPQRKDPHRLIGSILLLGTTDTRASQHLVPIRRRNISCATETNVRVIARHSVGIRLQIRRVSETERLRFRPMCLKEELLCKTSDPVKDCCHKVTIVGAGMVGVACANAILFQRIGAHLAIVDAFPKKLEGEGMDFNHGSVFMGDPRIDYGTDFCISSNSKVVIIASGVRQIKDESRLDLVQRNVEILKNIIPTLVGYSPNAVFVIVSNPVDILSWVTWKVSGLPVCRVIGSGTHLDSARFRYLIGDRLGIAASSIHGYIIGEHGDSQVPLWSGVNIAGVQFRDILPNIGLETDEEKWYEISKEVVKLGGIVRCLKGYTNTAVGLAVADIVRAILDNSQRVIPVSTLIQGHHEVSHEIYLSLPCSIGENGITNILRMRITEYEKKLFKNSANTVHNVQKDIVIKS